MSRSRGAASGLALVVLGAWGALVPFVGPYFDYAFGVDSTWHYTADRLWLSVLPGATAAIAGGVLLVTRRRPVGTLAAWCSLIAGTWFVVGPAVSLTWENGSGPIGRPLFDSTRQMLELLGCFYGLGVAIVALGAFASARVIAAPVSSAVASAPEPTAAPMPPQPAAAPTAAAPVSRAGERRDPTRRGGRVRRRLRRRRERRVGA
jgi:hypothetical protein